MSYFCSQCGYSTPSWLGKCPQCGEWNTFLRKERETKPRTHSEGKIYNHHVQAVSLSELSHKATEMASRFKTGLSEVDRVLGGGIVEGSLVLLSGDPGIGKSTLLLKISHSVASCGKKVLYVSSEESVAQLFLRINRLKIDSCSNLFLLSTNLAEDIFSEIERIGPDLVVVDSVQNLGFGDQQSSVGSVSVVKELSSIFMNIAKREKRAFFVVGHVTKEGVVAGPKTLEHLVDVVLYLEGDPHLAVRLLRSVKNRFGPTWEVGILEMKENGLVDVKDPSHLFLAPADLNGVGGARTVLVEGKRPLMVEIQSLVNNSYLDYPKRVALG
ncbi:MAG: AAA family ATPase, partial [Candidatus Atribacteria bacterium]|nr:AAA family ATPase [Candidatus Atribacteria bacterium]MCD6349543.1 AAA family ATPase [Candidatus Atribacteria bacterium]